MDWTPQEDQTLRDGLAAKKELSVIAGELGRSVPVVQVRAFTLASQPAAAVAVTHHAKPAAEEPEAAEAPKRRGRPRKEVAAEAPKRRGRPRKAAPEAVEEPEAEEAPKRRGRPRKAAPEAAEEAKVRPRVVKAPAAPAALAFSAVLLDGEAALQVERNGTLIAAVNGQIGMQPDGSIVVSGATKVVVR